MEREFVNWLDRAGQNGPGGGAIALGAVMPHGLGVALAQENEPCNVVGTCTANVNGYFRPARTTDGWTIVPQEDCDTKIVYVADAANGGNDLNLGGPNDPVLTMQRAFARLHALRGGQQVALDARIRIYRGSVFDGFNLSPNANDGKFGGKGPDDPLVIQAWPNPNDPRPEFQQPRPIFKLPADSDESSNNFGNMISEGYRFSGGGLCPSNLEWGGDTWIIGLEITSQKIEYAGEFYPPIGTKSAFEYEQGKGGRILIEDCYVHDMGSFGNFSGDESENKAIAGLTIRRNVISRTWTRAWHKEPGEEGPNYDAPMDQHRRASRSGGLYISQAKWALVEENFLNQCGWSHESNDLVAMVVRYNPLSPKSFYSQAMYIQPSSEHVLIRSNVVSEPAHAGIQSRGNLQRIEDNLVLEAPMGISMGHAENQPSNGTVIPERYWRGSTSNNVILNGENLDSWLINASGGLAGFDLGEDNRGVGMSLSRCRRFSGINGDGPAWNYFEDGQQFEAGTVFNNLVAHNDTGKWGLATGILSDDDRGNTTPSLVAKYSARVFNNVVINWKSGTGSGGYCIHISNTQGQQIFPLGPAFEFTGNYFVQPGANMVGRARWNPVGGTWDANWYYTAVTDPAQRYEVKPFGSSISTPPQSAPFTGAGNTNWKAATGETTVGEATVVPSRITDPTRNLNSYMLHANLTTISAGSQKKAAQHYMLLSEQQRRGNWNPALLAQNASQYIRAGYGL